MDKLILGSSSPRRKQILNFFSIPFTQVHSILDESLVPILSDPALFASQVAQKKAEALSPKYPSSIILTADTVVFSKDQIFTKPKDEKQAFAMLETLSGSWHSVYTGVCVNKQGSYFTKAQETKILFHPLSKKQIETYHKYFYCMDKAGGYAVQNAGNLIVDQIKGCFYNIMGLPLTTTKELLEKVGIDLWNYLKTF